jgi:fimbrial isopeptide formation D2 family protein/LPXTG-motif cell wall-anchored protein
MMVLGCISINVFAADTVGWTTSDVNNTLTLESSNANRSYKAYQLFYGDESDDVLSNIQYGISVKNVEELINALKSDTVKDGRTNIIKDLFEDLDKNTTASELAKIVCEIGDDSEQADMFAYIVLSVFESEGSDFKTTKTGVAANGNSGDSDYKYEFEIPLHDGYYIVKETSTIASDQIGSKIMVKVQGPTTIDTKENTAPTITKDILKYDAETKKDKEVKFDDVAIGDTVKFELKSVVPDMSGYNKYFFIMNDELSKGLDYDPTNDNMTVTINNETIDSTKYYVTSSKDTDTGVTTIKIVFKNFIGYQTKAGKPVVVTYTATVNSDILVGATNENTNRVQLIYSNNPNVSYVGKPNPDSTNPDNPGDNPEEGGDEPNDSEKGSIGNSQWSTVYVYTTALNIIKIRKGATLRLEGAEFTIVGEKLNTAIKTTYTYTPQRYYAEGDNETVSQTSNNLFFKTTDGAFEKGSSSRYQEYVKYNENHEQALDGAYYHNTKTGDYDLTIDPEATYDMLPVVYAREVVNTTIKTKEGVSLTGKTGADGQLYIQGLSAGTYTIKEIKAPKGYNLLANPITVVVSCNVEDKDSVTMIPTWTFTVSSDNGDNSTIIKTESNGTGKLEIENAAGTELPSTGGMGTTVFYVLGSILMAGAAILLISKRRMNAWNK